MATPDSSPVSQCTMSFTKALAAVIEGGKTITKLEWNDETIYGKLRDGFLMLKRNGKWHQWILNDGDLLGLDWIVLND